MQVNTLSVGELQTNCYVLRTDDGSAAIIDPGADAAYIAAYVEAQKLSVKAIWLTHGHYDHIAAVEALKQQFKCPVVACRAEQDLLNDPRKNLSLLFTGQSITVVADCVYDDLDTFVFGGNTVQVLHTPGHTAGSCCYVVGEYLFSGDTLFAGSMGRVDFPTGNPSVMQTSLRRLADLDGEYIVLSGHGCATSLETERRQNPYLFWE